MALLAKGSLLGPNMGVLDICNREYTQRVGHKLCGTNDQPFEGCYMTCHTKRNIAYRSVIDNAAWVS